MIYRRHRLIWVIPMLDKKNRRFGALTLIVFGLLILVGIAKPVVASEFNLNGPSVELRRVQYCVQCGRALIVTTVPAGTPIQCPNCHRVQARIATKFLLVKFYQVCPRCSSRLNVSTFTAGDSIRCGTCNLQQLVLKEAGRGYNHATGTGREPQGATRVPAQKIPAGPELQLDSYPPNNPDNPKPQKPESTQAMATAQVRLPTTAPKRHALPPQPELSSTRKRRSLTLPPLPPSRPLPVAPKKPPPPPAAREELSVAVPLTKKKMSLRTNMNPPGMPTHEQLFGPGSTADSDSAAARQEPLPSSPPVARAKVRLVPTEDSVQETLAIKLGDFESDPIIPKKESAKEQAKQTPPTSSTAVVSLERTVAQSATPAALVNGEAVLNEDVETDLAAVMKIIRRKLGDKIYTPQGRRLWQRKQAEVHDKVLRQLIDERLVLNEATKEGVVIPQPEIVARAEALRTQLRDVPDSAWLLRRARTDLIYEAMRHRHAAEANTVSLATCQTFYARKLKAFTIPPKVRLQSLIVFRNRTKRQDPRPAPVILREVVAALRTGETFGSVVARFADEPFRNDNGRVRNGEDSLVPIGMLAAPVRRALKTAKTGTLLTPIVLAGCLALIHVETYQPATTQPFKQVEPDIRDLLTKQADRAAFIQWVADLRARADIRIY